MKIVELNLDDYNNFAKTCKDFSFRQTAPYAFLKAQEGCEYDFIGLVDNNNEIHAAALIIVELINNHICGYIPNGILIDYEDEYLFETFTKEFKKYCKKEKIVYVKINPRIIINEIDYKNNKTRHINETDRINTIFEKNSYIKQNNDRVFGDVLPKFNAIVELDKYDFNKLNKSTKNKIRKGERKGLTLIKGSERELPLLYNFVKRKINISEFYYNYYYTIFNKYDSVDFFLLSINYSNYITNSQNAYEKEFIINQKLNQKLNINNSEKIINKKMQSDKNLLSYKTDVANASRFLNSSEVEYAAGALVIKNTDTVTIAINGYDTNLKEFSPNYYLFNEIIKYYKDDYKYLDLNGISGNFDKNNKYHGLNEFKFGFNPKVYEYIGEYDLIINEFTYNNLKRKNLLKK